MREYLLSFLKEFAYKDEDVRALTAAFDRLYANEAAWKRFSEAVAMHRDHDVTDHNRLIPIVDEAAVLCGVHEFTADLLLYILMTERLRERYRTLGIGEDIFYDTMCDLRYKLEECKAVKDVVGTFVPFWFTGFFDTERFAFGRLQFEPASFDLFYRDGDKYLEPDSTVINVHIPRDGTPLDKARCDEAYRRAAAFFRPKIQGSLAFVCYSWLLYPELKSILPATSNIVRFASQYELLKWGADAEGNDLWRLFDTDERNPDRLPQDTTARRCVAAHLKAGGRLGWGYGVFFAEE